MVSENDRQENRQRSAELRKSNEQKKPHNVLRKEVFRYFYNIYILVENSIGAVFPHSIYAT